MINIYKTNLLERIIPYEKRGNIERITPYEKRGNELLLKAQSLEINDNLDVPLVRDIMKKSQSLSKEVEDIRKHILKPIQDQVKFINSFAKKISEPIEESKKIAKDKIVAWEEEQERLRKLEMLKISQICSSVRNSKNKQELDKKISKIEEN